MRSEELLIEDEQGEVPQTTDLVKIIDYPSWKDIITDLVKTEQMDPWNIDVVELSKKYLDKINSMKKLNFRIPANAVLASSILVRLKSDEVSIEEDSLIQDIENGFNEDRRRFRLGVRIPELNLPQRVPKRKITLDELIGIIEDVIKEEKTRVDTRSILGTLGDPFDLAYDVISSVEEFNALADGVMDRIIGTLDKDGLTMFTSIVQEQTREEYTNVILSLLHLSMNNKISIWQDECFKEIFIKVREDGGRDTKPEKDR